MHYLFVIIATVSVVMAHDSLPADLSKEMYCTGCKATMNELQRVLQYHISEKMEKRVKDALGKVCHEDYFQNYEYSAKKLVKACKHLMDNHQGDLVPLLEDYFSKKSRKGQSYLYIAHIVCNKETFACGGVEEEDDDPRKGKIVYNDDKDDFDIHFGENVKMMKPVQESQAREEL
ncbi:uncharacterized protein LOC117329044 [Pecten maximus]|uniref:uncharacterized protein LOC117329044 n=1 Tax=Pecten maximus TaxID=6579 RepID=UPI001458D321|nr:uncharacterized protein LOC117329044 [Pecten maximus]